MQHGKCHTGLRTGGDRQEMGRNTLARCSLWFAASRARDEMKAPMIAWRLVRVDARSSGSSKGRRRNLLRTTDSVGRVEPVKLAQTVLDTDDAAVALKALGKLDVVRDDREIDRGGRVTVIVGMPGAPVRVPEIAVHEAIAISNGTDDDDHDT